MSRQYTKRFEKLQFKRIISATSNSERFQKFYSSLAKWCKTIRVMYLKVKNLHKVAFTIEVTY